MPSPFCLLFILAFSKCFTITPEIWMYKMDGGHKSQLFAVIIIITLLNWTYMAVLWCGFCLSVRGLSRLPGTHRGPLVLLHLRAFPWYGLKYIAWPLGCLPAFTSCQYLFAHLLCQQPCRHLTLSRCPCGNAGRHTGWGSTPASGGRRLHTSKAQLISIFHHCNGIAYHLALSSWSNSAEWSTICWTLAYPGLYTPQIQQSFAAQTGFSHRQGLLDKVT